MLAIAGILFLLLNKNLKAPHKLSAGVLHSALTALVAGMAMVGIRHSLNASDPEQWPLFNNTKISIKLLVVVAILYIGYKNSKKETISTATWASLVGLTVSNILIASLWH